MRLLLRANSYDANDTGGTRIAASPDTPGRERWQWELGIAQDPPDDSDEHHTHSMQLPRADDTTTRLVLTADASAVSATLAALDLSEPVDITREPSELLALVVARGVALVEGRHTLGELDTIVLAGDDPTTIRLEQISEEPVTLAMIRLNPIGADSLAWVP